MKYDKEQAEMIRSINERTEEEHRKRLAMCKKLFQKFALINATESGQFAYLSLEETRFLMKLIEKEI